MLSFSIQPVSNLSFLPVPHINQANIAVYHQKERISDPRSLPDLSVGGGNVEVVINGNVFSLGSASGDDCNCLINTLRQQLRLIANEKEVRHELNKRHRSGVGQVIPGDFLELEHHWADVIDLLFLFNESGCMPQLPDGRMWSTDYKIIAVDMRHLGNGDVVGVGNVTIYIARINGNHFVPLHPVVASSESSTRTPPRPDTYKSSDSRDTTRALDDEEEKGIDILSEFLKGDGEHHTAMDKFLHRVQFGDEGEEVDSSTESSSEDKEPDVMSDDEGHTL